MIIVRTGTYTELYFLVWPEAIAFEVSFGADLFFSADLFFVSHGISEFCQQIATKFCTVVCSRLSWKLGPKIWGALPQKI